MFFKDFGLVHIDNHLTKTSNQQPFNSNLLSFTSYENKTKIALSFPIGNDSVKIV